ncbi:hypothetical protein F4803DRAFT_569170 [Xylaria telfairii]|nr:hypothetical protein F4803DRAFT_569170 [Xylaria telfairii]
MAPQPENHEAEIRGSDSQYYETLTPDHNNTPQPENRGVEIRGSDSQHYETLSPDYDDTQQPETEMNGMWQWDDSWPDKIAFRFSPDPSNGAAFQDWEALLLVACSDIPCLMREGLYWDSDNVIDDRGFIAENPDVNTRLRQTGTRWHGFRYYYLQDLQQPRRWVATLQVSAVFTQTLFDFDLSQLLWDKISTGVSINQAGLRVYQFCYGQSQLCFNIVYPDIPLEGEWPWPRRDASGQADGTALALTDEEVALALTEEEAALALTEEEAAQRGVKRKRGED